MKPLNWTLGVLICLFCQAACARAQDSMKNPTGSTPALGITAHVSPALNAQIHDSRGRLESSVTSFGSAETSILSFDVSSDSDLILKTPEGTLFLRRIEIVVHFSGFTNEVGSISVSAPMPPHSAMTTLVEGPTPESVMPFDTNRRSLVSNAMRTGDRYVRYVGLLVGLQSDLKGPETTKCLVSYELGVP